MHATIDSWRSQPFIPSFWLKNKHVQTIMSALLNPDPCTKYRRERWETPDNDFLDIDFVDGNPENPFILACHGLEGSSASHYIRRLMAHVSDKGWNGAVLNFRSCSGEENRKLQSYNSGMTSDLDWVISKLDRKNIFLCGYSLGGNVVVKWLGEQGKEAKNKIMAACSCCNPFDLTTSQQALDRGFNRLYVQNFLKTLKRKAIDKIVRHGREKDFDLKKIKSSKTLLEFDDYLTAPLYGFQDYLDYYQKSSSKKFVDKIVIPTLFINALDDPFVPAEALPNVSSPYIKVLYIKHGGHIGFIGKGWDYSWLDRQILSWFEFINEK